MVCRSCLERGGEGEAKLDALHAVSKEKTNTNSSLLANAIKAAITIGNVNVDATSELVTLNSIPWETRPGSYWQLWVSPTAKTENALVVRFLIILEDTSIIHWEATFGDWVERFWKIGHREDFLVEHIRAVGEWVSGTAVG
jgi:hypothetical protein